MIDRVGPYEIQGELGRGGMGVVYRAVDARLDRVVAIKALPEELAGDAGRLERFEREARTLASLNHPNVGGILGIEEVADERGVVSKFLVLEFVDGETLAERLDRGPLDVDDAVGLACQIASGVEAAHEAGVIHRDLKPANIKITPEGVAKVLDFGLAKADEGASSTGSGFSQSPTLTTPAVAQHSPTIAGAILGTAAYMSPEQARGRRVDKRSDIWSFGVLLYEMLVGAGPFVGETATDSIGAVLHKDPDLGRLPAGVPRRVRELVRRCLERDKGRRVQSIGDARVVLTEALEAIERGEGSMDLAGAPARTNPLWPIAVVLLLGAVGVLGWLAVSSGDATGPGSSSRRAITSVRQLTDLPGLEQDPALSPDGKTLVFAMEDGGDLDLFSVRVGGQNPINLTPDSLGDDFQPAFSPDGQRIAYASESDGGGLFVMGATGENPRKVAVGVFDPSWSPDGNRLVGTSERVLTPFGRTSEASLSIVDLEARTVTGLDTGRVGDSAGWLADAVGPSWSPDGRWIAFWSVQDGQRDLWVSPIEGGERRRLTRDVATDWNPVWGPGSDRVYFVSDRLGESNLFWIGFDPVAGAVVGGPEPVLVGPMDIKSASVSADATRFAIVKRDVRTEISRVGFDPQTLQMTGTPRTIFAAGSYLAHMDVTPDGEKIVFRSDAPGEDLVTIRGDGSRYRRLTNDPYRNRSSQWSADGERIYFHSNRGGKYEIWEINADGTGLARARWGFSGPAVTPYESPDGRRVVFGIDRENGKGTALAERDDSGEYRVVGSSVDELLVGEWSPDGTRIAALRFDGAGGERYGVFSFERDLFTPFTGEIETGTVNGFDQAQWLDNDRLILIGGRRGNVLVVDAETGDARETGQSVEGDSGFAFPVNGGRELILEVFQSDSTVWLLELGGDG